MSLSLAGADELAVRRGMVRRHEDLRGRLRGDPRPGDRVERGVYWPARAGVDLGRTSGTRDPATRRCSHTRSCSRAPAQAPARRPIRVPRPVPRFWYPSIFAYSSHTARILPTATAPWAFLRAHSSSYIHSPRRSCCAHPPPAPPALFSPSAVCPAMETSAAPRQPRHAGRPLHPPHPPSRALPVPPGNHHSEPPTPHESDPSVARENGVARSPSIRH